MLHMSTPLVIDLYHGDRVLDFAETKAFGIVGVIHKASEGLDNVDPAYEVRRSQWTATGGKWGAYHFFHGVDPVGEANHFLSVAQPDADTLLALDWETANGRDPDVDRVRAFLGRVINRTGRMAAIYSGNVAKEQLGNSIDGFLGNHRLWLAQYGKLWNVQKSWTVPWLWQNNGDASGPGPHYIPGIAGTTDNSCIVAGSVETLVAGWAG